MNVRASVRFRQSRRWLFLFLLLRCVSISIPYRSKRPLSHSPMVLGHTPHCVALRNASSHSGSTLGDALGRIYDRPTSLYRASKLVLMRFLRVADRFCGLQPFSSHWRGLRRDPSSAHPKITRDSRGGAFASAFICLIYLFFFVAITRIFVPVVSAYVRAIETSRVPRIFCSAEALYYARSSPCRRCDFKPRQVGARLDFFDCSLLCVCTHCTQSPLTFLFQRM